MSCPFFTLQSNGDHKKGQHLRLGQHINVKEETYILTHVMLLVIVRAVKRWQRDIYSSLTRNFKKSQDLVMKNPKKKIPTHSENTRKIVKMRTLLLRLVHTLENYSTWIMR